MSGAISLLLLIRNNKEKVGGTVQSSLEQFPIRLNKEKVGERVQRSREDPEAAGAISLLFLIRN